MNRPYIHYRTREILSICKRSLHNTDTLYQLRQELSFRKDPEAYEFLDIAIRLNEAFERDFGFLTRFNPETLTLEQAYKALNAHPESSIEEISRVRRKLVQQNHPDKFATHDEKYRRLAEHEMKVINRAYDLIMRQKTTN